MLDLGSRESILNETVDTYARVGAGFDDIIFTKLDETEEYGSILNISVRCRQPISYLTTGQKVPEDIREAQPGQITDLCLGKGLAGDA